MDAVRRSPRDNAWSTVHARLEGQIAEVRKELDQLRLRSGWAAVVRQSQRATRSKGLLNLSTAARKLHCSRDHLRALINDGELEYVDLARPGSKHREIRLTLSQLQSYVARRSVRGSSVLWTGKVIGMSARFKIKP